MITVRAKRELYRKSKCRVWLLPQGRSKPGGATDLLAPRLTAGPLGRAGHIICGTESPVKMWSRLFREQEKTLLGFPCPVFLSTSHGIFHLLLNVVLLWARECSCGECRPAQGPCPVTRHMCSPLVARLPLYLQLDQCTVSQLVTGTSRQACPLPMGLLPQLTVEQRLPKGFHLLRWEVPSIWTGDRLEAGGHIRT